MKCRHKYIHAGEVGVSPWIAWLYVGCTRKAILICEKCGDKREVVLEVRF